jgi:hypothetical protein
MIPTISPPTDNLYKFIALFGLAIFLFSLYRSGDAFEAVTKTKIQLEDLKLKINRSLPFTSNGNPVIDTASVNVVPVMVKRLSDDLESITETISSSGLSPLEQEVLLTDVRKLQVQNDNYRIKTTEFITTLLLGFILIILGFWLWYKKDQVIKDKMLIAELNKSTPPSNKEEIVSNDNIDLTRI